MRTIYALSSGVGRAALAVIRLSGPLSGHVVERMTQSPLPSPRYATLVRLSHPQTGEWIDQGLVLWFKGPASFTGEDSAEFHIHGGSACIKACLQALSDAGCSPAEPGEFTRRAFINGKMDLASVEGLADLIEAETRLQHRQALASFSAGLAARTHIWRTQLTTALALIEAHIDFTEEEDVPHHIEDEILPLLQLVYQDLTNLLAQGARGQRVREGFTLVLAGPPNAGKSTLMNALVGQEVAIVSERAGTTRDVIEVHLDLNGIPVTLVDTAGIQATQDPVEREGIKRAIQRAERADLVLWLVPLGEEAPLPSQWPKERIVRVWTKADVVRPPLPRAEDALYLCALSGLGISDLLEYIQKYAQESLGGTEPALLTRARHRLCVSKAAKDIERLIEGMELPIEIMAEYIRSALQHLQALIGKVDVEDVLEDLFSRFCIGK